MSTWTAPAGQAISLAPVPTAVLSTNAVPVGVGASCLWSKNMTHRASVEQRFWAKVDRRRRSECWPWLARHDPHGYGSLNIRRHAVGASRLSWMLNPGPIPSGLCVCHHCDNPGCVNPDHLYLGTRSQNAQDMVQRGRQYQPKWGRYNKGEKGRE